MGIGIFGENWGIGKVYKGLGYIINKMEDFSYNEINFDVQTSIDGSEIKAEVNVKNKRNMNEDGLTDRINRVMEENEVGLNKFCKINNNSNSIGMVVYMTNEEYSQNANENSNIHIKCWEYKEIIPKIIEEMIKRILDVDVDQIVVGHEHGTRNSKCHLQIAIKLKKVIRKVITPGEMTIMINGVKDELIFMQQKGKNSRKLMQYCMKDGDFVYLDMSKVIRPIYDSKGKLDPFATVVANKTIMSEDDAKEYLQRKSSRVYMTGYNNVSNAVSDIIEKELPEFEWIIPNHLNDFDVPSGNFRVKFMSIFMDWFNKNCLNNPDRKKALCLYSKDRGLGKTMFVRNLVNDKGYLLEYNNTFTMKKLTQNYKLLLLDDMRVMDARNMQTWLSLVASQSTTLRDCYLNQKFDLNLPCIITTNSMEMIMQFVHNPLFNTQVIVVEIDKYMGPPNTYRADLYKQQIYISTKTFDRMIVEEREHEKKEEYKKNVSKILFNVYKGAIDKDNK